MSVHPEVRVGAACVQVALQSSYTCLSQLLAHPCQRERETELSLFSDRVFEGGSAGRCLGLVVRGISRAVNTES